VIADPGAVLGWTALGAMPLTAAVGALVRRRMRGPLAVRMRPHYALGYAALVAAGAHLATTTSSMGGANATGIWLATAALAALGVQAFVGASLQSPGTWRAPLRRWHLVVFVVALAAAGMHVLLNAPVAGAMMMR
jgi:hypothetical protein